MKKNKEAELDCSGTFIGLMSNKLTENYWNKINEHKNNMKTYRLIKWYPSLPKDWKVGMEIGQGDDVPRYYSPCSAVFKNYYAHKDEIENNPDFWQEVDEVLFTTNDGVGIHIGDTIYEVYRHSSNTLLVSKIMALSEHTIDECIAVFSTKEKALEFIEDNQQKYSKKDMIDFGKHVASRANNFINDVNGYVDGLFNKNFKK